MSNAFAAFLDDYTVYVFDRNTDVPKGYSISDRAANIFLENRTEVIGNLETLKNKTLATIEMEKELENTRTEIEVLKEMYGKGLSSGPLTGTSSIDSVLRRYTDLSEKEKQLGEEVASRRDKRNGINRLIRQLKETDTMINEFSEELFTGLADHMTIYGKDNIGVTFRDGREIIIR